jgi:hypothetical protein
MLLIKPGTVHAHWNESTTARLVVTEFILVDEGQRSVVFVDKWSRAWLRPSELATLER